MTNEKMLVQYDNTALSSRGDALAVGRMVDIVCS